MDARELADLISAGVRRIRLKRSGNYSPAEIERDGVPFDQLPSADQQNWIDVASAVLELREQGRL